MRVAVLILGGALAACWPPPPPYAPGDVPCSSDGQCSYDQHCGFPGVNVRARCMPGAPDVSNDPFGARRPDAGGQ